MDTLETYIKMRRAAIPSLGMGIPPELVPNTEVTWITTFVFADRKGDFYYSSVDETFQLERQDQLQEMVEVEDYPYTLVEKFWAWFNAHNYSDEPIDYESMEQFWLAFVMKEQYNKVWDGENWIKGKEVTRNG